MVSDKKIKIPLFLPPDLLKRVNLIVDDEETLFEDRGQYIRHCLRAQLPITEKQIREEKQNRRG